MLAVRGENARSAAALRAPAGAFGRFVERHRVRLGSLLTAEDNVLMTGSYAMVDPAGRFFSNATGAYTFSRPIREVGVDAAFMDIRFSRARFLERGGSWRRECSLLPVPCVHFLS